MIFTSFEYLIFLAAVLAVYWCLGHRAQNALLLAAGALFYGWVHPGMLGLLAGVVLTAWACAWGMVERPAWRRPLLWLALTVCLGSLGVFKYANFFLDNLAALLAALGLGQWRASLDLVLPVGVSFFTFLCLGYVLDVHHGRLEPRRGLAGLSHFALMACFFPTLQAGPIERGGHLLPQIENPRRFDPARMRDGLFLLIWGFFQKLVVADNLSVTANKIFALKDPDFWLLWTGVLAFTFQILADFSGYTDIARGSARLLGFTLLRNFDQPYLAASPADFWRRWHMSLSYWLRDYVYIPLGGSRTGALRGGVNILATFLLSGLWHGANWNFILWGLYHGLLVLGERVWRRIAPRRRAGRDWLAPVKVALTFALVTVGWLFFRETDLAWIGRYLSLSPWGPEPSNPLITRYLLWTTLLYACPLLAHAVYDRLARRARPGGGLARRIALFRPLAAGLLLLGVLLLASPESGVFIYFKF